MDAPPLEPLARIAYELEAAGWSCRDGFVDAGTVRELRREADELHRAGRFRPAAIGAGARRTVRRHVRGDEIFWIEDATTPAMRVVRRAFEELRVVLNRDLQLGLFEHEVHFARYGAGTVYERHVDRLEGSGARVVSTVLYLNENWRDEEGGALRLHLVSGAVDLYPCAGRLVAFLSERFEHQVLPAQRERLSLTGWFRRRS